jgi:hypothetical protein
MLGLGWTSLLKGMAVILCAFGVVSLVLVYFFPAPPATITIASGFTGGNYERIAARYQKVLARHHVTLEMRGGSGGGTTSNCYWTRTPGFRLPSYRGEWETASKRPGCYR